MAFEAAEILRWGLTLRAFHAGDGTRRLRVNVLLIAENHACNHLSGVDLAER